MSVVRTINFAEHSLFADPPAPVTLANNTSTQLIPNQVGDNSGEIAYRYVQNVGANPIYYSIGGSPANTSSYHGIIPANSMLDVSNHRLAVFGYATGGSTAAITIIRRQPQV